MNQLNHPAMGNEQSLLLQSYPAQHQLIQQQNVSWIKSKDVAGKNLWVKRSSRFRKNYPAISN